MFKLTLYTPRLINQFLVRLKELGINYELWDDFCPKTLTSTHTIYFETDAELERAKVIYSSISKL